MSKPRPQASLDERMPHKYVMSSKELVLISKALRGKYSAKDAPAMQALLKKLEARP